MLKNFEMLEGFNEIEQADFGPFVWTKGVFTLCPNSSARFAKLSVAYLGKEGSITVRAADGRMLDAVELEHGWHICVLQLAGVAHEPVSFEISPIIDVPGDTRELGLMLRSAELFDDAHAFKVLTKTNRNLRLNQREFLAGTAILKSFPPQLRTSMEVRCNLPELDQACVYCAWDHAKMVEVGSPPFTYETLQELGDFYDCAVEVVDCSIGEPAMHKDFGKIISKIHDDGKLMSFTTNGQLLGAVRRKQMLGKNMIVYVSIDASTAEGYARYRNKRFDDIIENLTALCRDKKEHGDLPRVFVTFLVMRSNVAELPQYIELMKKVGVDEVKLRSLNLDSLESQPTVTNNGYTFEYGKEILSMQELAELQPISQKLSQDMGVKVYNETHDFAEQNEPLPGVPLCSEPWKTMYFLRRGIMPCCYGVEPLATWDQQGDRSVGQFLGDIFNGETLTEIRSELAAGRLAQYCLNTPSCPIVKTMKLQGLIDPSFDMAGIAAPKSGPLPMVTLESLKATATTDGQPRAA